MQACRLAATEIACRRGDRVLFSGLSFALGGGEALQLSGPNGIGKSSLIRILGGLLRPFAGTVAHDGAAALSDERLALDGHQPLERALDFWASLDGTVPDIAAYGLDDLLDVPVRFLSTGQRKRAVLARVTASAAPIWLLDEPLNGLDTQWSSVAQSRIAQHCADGGIAVVASHQTLTVPALKTIALAEYAK